MKLSDHETLQILKSGGAGVHKIMDYLYMKSRNKIINYVAKNGGSKEDGKDVLQETIAAFYTNIKNNKFRGEGDIEGYIYGIARNKWLRAVKAKGKIESYDAFQIMDVTVSEDNAKEDKLKSLDNVLKKLDEVCRNLLVHAFYFNYSADEIRKKFNFKNEQVSRNKKYKCLKKLRNMMEKSKNIKS